MNLQALNYIREGGEDAAWPEQEDHSIERANAVAVGKIPGNA